MAYSIGSSNPLMDPSYDSDYYQRLHGSAPKSTGTITLGSSAPSSALLSGSTPLSRPTSRPTITLGNTQSLKSTNSAPLVKPANFWQKYSPANILGSAGQAVKSMTYDVPKGLVQGGVQGAFGSKLLTAQQKENDVETQNMQRIADLQKQGKVNPNVARRTLFGLGQEASQPNFVTKKDVTQAQPSSSQVLQTTTNPRNIIASGANTVANLLPFGRLAELPAAARVAATSGVMGTGGFLGALGGEKPNYKSALKQGVLQAGIGAVLGTKTPELTDLKKPDLTAEKTSVFSQFSKATERVPRGEPVHVDPVTDTKMGVLHDQASAVQRPANTTRVFQVVGGNKGQSNYFFNNIDDLAKRQNNITSSTDQFNFHDVPKNWLQEVSGKPGVFKLTPLGEEGFIGSTPKVTTPSSLPAQVEDTLQKAKMATSASNVKGAVKEWQNLFSLGKGAQPVQSDLRSALGEFGAAKNQQQLGMQDVTKFFDKQKPGDNLSFIQKIETGAPQTNAALDKSAGMFRDWFNQDYELAKTLKPDVHYMENYFSQSGVWANPQAADAFAKKWVTNSLGGKPGALEQRVIPTIYDGVKNGLELRENNPMTIALNNRASLLRAKMSQDFTAEQAAKGVDPELTQKVLDRYLGTGLNNSMTFKTVKDVGYALNNAQLGLSGFHFTGTGLNSIFSNFGNGIRELTTGHPIQAAKNIVTAPMAPIIDAVSGKALRAAEAAGDTTNPYVQYAHQANFPLFKGVDYSTTGLAKTMRDFRTGNLKGMLSTPLTAPFRALSSAAKPLMEHWVPAIKAGAFQHGVDAELNILGDKATPAATQAAVQRVADSIDNRFGQLTKDNLFWNNKVKDASQILMRSPGWNIGTVREVGGGVANLLKPSTYAGLAKGEGLPANTTYTMGLAAGTMMVGGTISYLFTGQWPKTALDYFYPRTGQTDKNGNPERVSLPTYAKDVFAFTHNPGQTIANKATPLISMGKETITNKDYFGNQVRNPQDSAATQASQTLKFLGKGALPFSLQSANKRVDQSPSAKAQSFLGLGVAPGYVTKSSFEQKAQAAYNQAVGSTPKTPEEQAIQQLKTSAKQGLQGGDRAKLDQLLQSGQITTKQAANIEQAAGKSSLQNVFSLLLTRDRSAAAKLLTQASPQDRAKLGDTTALKQQMAYDVMHQSTASNAQSLQAAKDILKALGITDQQQIQSLAQQKTDQIKQKAKTTRQRSKAMVH